MTALRYNGGKPKLSYLLEFGHASQGLAQVMEFGATKYDRGNWQKGLPYTEVADSLLRHLRAFLNGEDLDPDSGLPHADLVVANAMFLAEFTRTHKELDDRYSGGGEDGTTDRAT